MIKRKKIDLKEYLSARGSHYHNAMNTINEHGFIGKKMRGGFKNNSRKRRMKKEGAF